MMPVMVKRDARSLDHATLEEMRRLAVRQVLSGKTQMEVAHSVQVHPRAVNKWMQMYREGGDRALASRKASGRPPTLSPKQQARLRRLLVDHDPTQLRFPFALWTLPLVQQLLERDFGVVLHKTSVSRLLGRLGMTPQKPIRRAFQRDEGECARWVREEFPAIVRQVRRRQSTLLFEDESGVHEDGPVARTWGLKGRRPVVRVTGTRRRVNVISSISPRGRLWFRSFSGTLTAPRFVGFLEALLHDVRGEIDLVLDKHPAHVAAATRRFLRDHPRLRLHYLPSYAPDMNPDEHVWSYLKGLFRRHPLGLGEDLAASVHASMDDIQRDRALVRSFFQHPEVLYVRKALKW
jgi:transposase